MTGHGARGTMPEPAAQLVSVVIPVFNGARYVAEAIDSALAQTWPAVEVIVVDDGSDDGGSTQRIVASYGSAVRLIAKPNGGVGSALNAGIAAMKGAWFSWLSHDDLYLPNKIERLMRALEGQPGPAIAFSDVEFIDQDGQFIAHAGLLKGLVDEPDARWLVLEGRLNGCAMMIPRECLDAVGPFDTGLPTTQDYAMWFELASRYRFVPVHEVLVRSRVHGQQGSRHAGHLDEASALWLRMTDRMERSAREADPLGALKHLGRVQRFLRRSPYQSARVCIDERVHALLGAVEVGLVCLVGPAATPEDALQRLAAAGVRCTEVLLVDAAGVASTARGRDHATFSACYQTVHLPNRFAKPGNILTVALANTRADVLVIIDASAPLDDRVLHEGLLTIATQEADVWMGAGPELPSLGMLQGAVLVRAAIAPTMAAGPQAFPMLGLRARLIIGPDPGNLLLYPGNIQMLQERAAADLLAQERARADALAQQIALLESSNTYRAALVLRRLGSPLPPRLRILIRRLVTIVWWTVRGQLLVALRARTEFLHLNAEAPDAYSAADAAVPPVPLSTDSSAPPGGPDPGNLLLAQERARADALAQRIALLESSNTYRAALVLRRVGSRLPPRLRILIRRLVKLVWWTVRGQLLVALRARTEFLHLNAEAHGAPPAAHASVAPAPLPTDSSTQPLAAARARTPTPSSSGLHRANPAIPAPP